MIGLQWIKGTEAPILPEPLNGCPIHIQQARSRSNIGKSKELNKNYRSSLSVRGNAVLDFDAAR